MADEKKGDEEETEEKDSDRTDYENLGLVVPLHRIKAPTEEGGRAFFFAFSETKADGNIGDVKFEVLSNLDGTIVVEFGEKSLDQGERYVVRIRDVIEAAYKHHKVRKP